MSYIGYIDLFKHALEDPLADFEMSVSGGTPAANLPLTHAQTRNLGTKFRNSGAPTITITLESHNCLTTADKAIMPTCVGILGHNLNKNSLITVTTYYRVGATYNQQHVLFDDREDKFNSDFFINRQRFADVPYKVDIVLTRTDGLGYIDVGRIWAGPSWDLGDNDSGLEIKIQEGWTVGMIQGAQSELTRGNQSYSDNAAAFKAADFKIVTTDENEFLGVYGKRLNDTPNLLGFINEIEGGGECIAVVREYDYESADKVKGILWSTRVGIYGESAKGSHVIKEDSALQFSCAVKLRELL